jgi:hypothetical protein
MLAGQGDAGHREGHTAVESYAIGTARCLVAALDTPGPNVDSRGIRGQGNCKAVASLRSRQTEHDKWTAIPPRRFPLTRGRFPILGWDGGRWNRFQQRAGNGRPSGVGISVVVTLVVSSD